ncbi:MAG: FMN-binding protein [Prevotella sp.]|nr:FMN-binding protein [Prevotellaceae bacterium]MDY3936487.1 FMN-binding protein [Prevotella sp.]
MKKQILTFAALAIINATAIFAADNDKVMQKLSDGTYVVNTTTLAADVRGFKGATPLEVHIKKDKIVKVAALKNKETPRYFSRVEKEMLPKYGKRKISKASEVDGVTGATFSSRAVKANVEAALKYYKANK